MTVYLYQGWVSVTSTFLAPQAFPFPKPHHFCSAPSLYCGIHMAMPVWKGYLWSKGCLALPTHCNHEKTYSCLEWVGEETQHKSSVTPGRVKIFHWHKIDPLLKIVLYQAPPCILNHTYPNMGWSITLGHLKYFNFSCPWAVFIPSLLLKPPAGEWRPFQMHMDGNYMEH